ncbi:MAG: long-chain fatty acid--CoA ligase [Balneolales bacterium]|nr:long-chain fatty acid--CoA ligase [Balneolales bacterium]
MEFEPRTIFDLANDGRNKNNTGLIGATKRNGVWIELTIDSFYEQVCFMALGLYDLGIRKGDRVALHSENSVDWLICDQAILSLGAINVPIYTTQPGDQIKFILEDSGAKIYLYSQDKLYNNFKPYKGQVEGLQTVCIVETSEKGIMHKNDLLEKGKEMHNNQPTLFETLKKEVSPDDLASFIYTSGTTGQPKGVMLTHHNISSNVQYSVERIPFDIEGERGGKILSYLPLSHIFERMLNYLYMNIGYPIFYIENVEDIKEDLNLIKPMFFATVPRLLEKIYTGIINKVKEGSGLKGVIGGWALNKALNYDIDNPPTGFAAFMHGKADKLVFKKIRDGFGGELLGMISGGAALSPQIMNFFTGIGFRCHQGYGLTETSPVLTVTTTGAIKVGSSGRKIRCVELKIADDGEILAKGPNIMQGYYNRPDATAEVLSSDGWFSTGDVGKIDDEGFLYITDRKKDIFKLSTGKYVAPQHVENTLLNSPLIEQVVVLGASKKFCSALIVPNLDAVTKKLGEGSQSKPDFEKQVEKLIQAEVDRMNEPLPVWERIKKFALLDSIFSIDGGELTPTMKTKRRVIHDKYRIEIDRIYEE